MKSKLLYFFHCFSSFSVQLPSIGVDISHHPLIIWCCGTPISPAYAGFLLRRASVPKLTQSLPTPVSATSAAPQLVPVVCKVSPNVRDALKQLLTLKRTTICKHLLDLISISLSDMAKVCPSADKLLKLGGLSPDPRADKICAGWACSICTHYTKCMQGDPDVLFMPTKEHLDNARSRGWKIEVSYEEVTVMKPVISVTQLASEPD